MIMSWREDQWTGNPPVSVRKNKLHLSLCWDRGYVCGFMSLLMLLLHFLEVLHGGEYRRPDGTFCHTLCLGIGASAEQFPDQLAKPSVRILSTAPQ